MIRRVLASLLQIVAISAIAFFLFSVAPGDFYSAERLSPQLHGRSIEQWRGARGLDRPWPVRYARWIESCARGDFGTSLAYGIPVTRLVAPRVVRSAVILFPAWIFGWIVAVCTAAWAARRRDRMLEPAMTILNMSPEVIVVSVLLWIGVALRIPLERAWLPSMGLILAIAPLVFIHAFRAVSEAQSANFVRIAASRGIASRRLWIRFILPAAANPLISLIGPSLAAAIGSSLVIEAMSGWPGLGPLFLEAVQSRDYDVVQAVVVMLGAVLTFTNLAADLILYRLDPRIHLNTDGAH